MTDVGWCECECEGEWRECECEGEWLLVPLTSSLMATASPRDSAARNKNVRLPPEVNRILFVRNLPYKITAEEVRVAYLVAHACTLLLLLTQALIRASACKVGLTCGPPLRLVTGFVFGPETISCTRAVSLHRCSGFPMHWTSLHPVLAQPHTRACIHFSLHPAFVLTDAHCALQMYDIFGKYGPVRQIRLGNAADTRGKVCVYHILALLPWPQPSRSPPSRFQFRQRPPIITTAIAAATATNHHVQLPATLGSSHGTDLRGTHRRTHCNLVRTGVCGVRGYL